MLIWDFEAGSCLTWLSHDIVCENESQMTNNKQAQMVVRLPLCGIIFIVERL